MSNLTDDRLTDMVALYAGGSAGWALRDVVAELRRTREINAELLEALKALLADIDREPNSEYGFPSYSAARAALSKATGTQE